jgi:hypothetical protein
MIKIHVHVTSIKIKSLCQIFVSKSYLEGMGYEKENMRIKDAMLKGHEPKKEKREKTMGTLMPVKKIENNGCNDTRQ